MTPPCLHCQIHHNKECKYNVFCIEHCKARIQYSRYIDKLIENSYLAVDYEDEGSRYDIQQTSEIKKLFQEIDRENVPDALT